MRELGQAQIHLWEYPIGQTPVAQHLDYAMTILNDAERRRCAAFHSEKHRAEYALSHAMLRLALSGYESVNPDKWVFSTGEWGRPEIAGPALDAPLWFNLSHTDGFVACVIGRVPKIGVDVENINRITPSDELAKRFFAAPEYQYLTSHAPPLQRDAFFRIWTLKEAYIKAEGKGLSIPLDSFRFRFPDARSAEIVLTPENEPPTGVWTFFEVEPSPDHRISVAVQGTGTDPFDIQRQDAALLFAK